MFLVLSVVNVSVVLLFIMRRRYNDWYILSTVLVLMFMLCWDVHILANEPASYIYMSRKRTPEYFFNEGEKMIEDKRYAEALELYLQAAHMGHVDAQYKVGYMYQCGQGAARDHVSAAYWYEKAAEQGDCDSQYKLAYCYKQGVGREQNYAMAIYWFKRASEQGDEISMCEIGVCYVNGLVILHISYCSCWWGNQLKCV